MKARGARKRRLMKYLGTILVKIEDFGKFSLSEAIWDLVDTSRCPFATRPFCCQLCLTTLQIKSTSS